MKPLVSVIVPVYNSEKYLAKCLESIINQTLYDIEIICVNDGSTDASLTILKKYAANDCRIKIVDKKNGGLVSARKAGIAEAVGEYVGYVDSDDWIEVDMYATLYELASQYNVDVVSSGYFLEGNYTTEHIDVSDSTVYYANNIQELRNNLIYNMKKNEIGLRGSLCCKLFKRELLEEVQTRIPESISMSEDTVCLMTYLLECSSAYILKRALYHWVNHDTSMTHDNSINSTYLVQINEVYKYLTSLYTHPNFTDMMRNQVEVYIVSLLTNGINRRMGFKNKNLLRIDPYWLENIPENARLITYGGADLLEQYKVQLRQRSDICVIKDLGFEFPLKETLDALEYDYILITIKNKSKADSIRNEFKKLGVQAEKILWFEQPEFYWKYAKAQGLLEE